MASGLSDGHLSLVGVRSADSEINPQPYSTCFHDEERTLLVVSRFSYIVTVI
jgi:hypothetical protein